MRDDEGALITRTVPRKSSGASKQASSAILSERWTASSDQLSSSDQFAARETESNVTRQRQRSRKFTLLKVRSITFLSFHLFLPKRSSRPPSNLIPTPTTLTLEVANFRFLVLGSEMAMTEESPRHLKEQADRQVEDAKKTMVEMTAALSESRRLRRARSTDMLPGVGNSTLPDDLVIPTGPSGHRSARHSNVDVDDLKQEEALLKSKILEVQRARQQDEQDMQSQLSSALSSGRERLQLAEGEVTRLRAAVEQERRLRTTAEHEREDFQRQVEQLRHNLREKDAEIQILTRVTRDQVATGHSARSEVVDAIREARLAMQQRDLSQAKVASLEVQLRAIHSGVDVASPNSADKATHLSRKEELVRDEIRQLQEERAQAMKAQIHDLEEERDTHTRVVSDLELRLTKAQGIIDTLGSQVGVATAREEELQRERDIAIQEAASFKKDKIQLAKELNDVAKFTQATATRAPVSPPVRPIHEEELQQALDQRDAALRKYHEILLHSGEASSAALQQSRERIRVLESALHKEQDKGRQQDMLLQSTSAMNSVLQRSIRKESTSPHTITLLERQLHRKDQELAHATRELDDTKAKLAIATASFASPPDIEAVRAMAAGQRLSEVYRTAATNLKTFVRQLAQLDDLPRGAMAESHLIAASRDAAIALAQADTSLADTLPPNWEAQLSPQGLVYYIDHAKQTTTWINPMVSADYGLQQAEDQFPLPSFSTNKILNGDPRYGHKEDYTHETTDRPHVVASAESTLSKLRRVQHRRKTANMSHAPIFGFA